MVCSHEVPIGRVASIAIAGSGGHGRSNVSSWLVRRLAACSGGLERSFCAAAPPGWHPSVQNPRAPGCSVKGVR